MDADFYEKHNPRFLTADEIQEQTATDDPYPAVPTELKALPQWVLWASEIRDGKPTKIPKQTTELNASSTDASTWTTYEQALKVEQTGKFDGIGFVFTNTDDYAGFDLDNCIANGEVKPWAREILDRFADTDYREVSPSGNGIKMWTRAKLSADAKHKVYIDKATGEAIEAYDKGRFFTVTGRGKFAIGNGQDAVDWLVAKYLKKDTPTTSPVRPPVKDTRDTSEIKQLIENSRQRAKFSALMQGNWEGQGYGSHSEADEGLCCVIAFWTRDPRHIDAIFRQSALYRDKWDEKHRSDGATYGEMTIEKALIVVKETYTPHQKQKFKRREGFYQTRAKRRRYGYQR